MSSASPDAIVVLGCRVETTGDLSLTLRRRANWAEVAYRTGLGRFIVTSGGRRWGDHVEADRLRAYLVDRGVPDASIHAELLSLTTAENAVFCGEVLARIGARRALLVTCDWHMPRALACFRTVGVDALPLPVPPAPADLWTRIRRRGHEVVSTRLDAWTLRRMQRVRSAAGGHPFDPRAEASR